MNTVPYNLGIQLKEVRRHRNLSQPALASRVGRAAPRISELERDLLKGRMGRDRLSLLLEICEALHLEILLVPRARLAAVRDALDLSPPAPASEAMKLSAYDDIFVDLGDEED